MNQNEKLLNAMENIDDAYVTQAAQKSTKRPVRRFLAPMAAGLALTVALGAGYLAMQGSTVLPQEPAGPIADQGQIMGGITDTSPMQARRFFNYNGTRYVYGENIIPQQFVVLGDELGEITADLSLDAALAETDLAGTFAPGSKIYAVGDYAHSFRLAVSDETGVYVCQAADTAQATGLDLSTFLSESGILAGTEEIAVFDHFAQEFLGEMDKATAQTLLQALSSAEKATLQNADYEQIAAAQTTGKSVTVECKLQDGTVYSFYAIPEMNLANVGDTYYTVSAEVSTLLQGALA